MKMAQKQSCPTRSASKSISLSVVLVVTGLAVAMSTARCADSPTHGIRVSLAARALLASNEMVFHLEGPRDTNEGPISLSVAFRYNDSRSLALISQIDCQRAVKTSHEWANQTQPF